MRNSPALFAPFCHFARCGASCHLSKAAAWVSKEAAWASEQLSDKSHKNVQGLWHDSQAIILGV
jgi:hypothetical protein